ncbi:MAG: Gfo/Idh/MocA family protein [Fimbriimonas sp.]
MSKVRVAMIGCGGFQRHRLSNLLSISDVEVVALVDTSEEQIRLTRERYAVLAQTPSFADHQTMLAEIKPDAVAIATPHTQHVDQILDCLNAGAHTLCEKPLVTSVEDAHRVIEARDRNGKVGMVSYQRHFQAEFRYIREKIRSGEAGKVNFVQALQSQEWLRATKGTWRQIHSLSGGGQLNDSGSHLLDILLWVTGLQPEAVSAFSDNFGTEVDINSAVSVRFKGGAMANMSIVGDGHAWHEDITFVCENLTFFMRQGKLSITDVKQNRVVCEHISGGSTPDKNFIDAILGRAECESPFECGLEVIRLTEAAWESAAAGGTVIAAK